MKVIDAFWEKRNLGVTSTHIHIEPSDTPDAVRQCIHENPAQYTIIYCPPARFDLNTVLFEEKFINCESLIKFRHDLKKHKTFLSRAMQKILDHATFDLLPEAEHDALFDEVRKDVYDKADRMLFFGWISREKRIERIVYMIKDYLAKGAELFQMRYKGDPVGFSMIHVSAGVPAVPIMGVYKDVKILGVGNVLRYLQIDQIAQKGFKSYDTWASTNNPASVKLHFGMGAEYLDMQYIYARYQP